ncbi:hypothetical protein CLOM_g15610 [Closterium sp. NIES-68]|nr:hypothetical protein CLOM_g15610 [Closterium sp. NIES-68]
MLGDDAEDESEECAFAFFSPVEIPGEPTNPKEAWEGPNGKEWKKASDEEMGSIIENDTFDLVNLPPGRKAISSKWLFKRKTDADGNIERYKSRLVAKGYQQQEKKDFNEVYAPVVKGTTLRTLFAAAAIKGWVVKQMDIVTAFLNGVLEEETYMEQPEGYNDGRFKCVKGPAEESVGEEDRRRFHSLVGSLMEVVWQRRLLAELGEEQQGPTPLYCDSQGAIALAKNPVLHGLTKHMKVKWHWVRSMVTSGEVELHYVKTTAQPADMMTKRLVEQQHWKCCKLAGMALN